MPECKIKTLERLTDEYGDEESAREILASSCQTCGYPSAQAGDTCETCIETGREIARQYQRRLRSWRTFLHGSGAVHSFTHGWLDPHDRYDKRHLDP